MRGSILLLFLILTVAPAARAQTAVVYGTVEDELGHPVPGAHVVLENTTVGAVAAMDGTYTIESVPPGPQTLVASAVGFRRTTRSVVAEPGARLGVDFVLEEILLESGEVVVTALRRPEVTALVPVSVSVVTNEDLQDRNVLALDDALRYTPGVQMAENQVNIRGSSGFSYNVGSRVLLLVDGVPMLGPETGGVPFDALPLPQVARIEVVKGPGSALYGSGALGGVINVITRDRYDGFALEAEARGPDSFGGAGFTSILSAIAGGALSDSVHLTGAVSWRDTDGVEGFETDFIPGTGLSALGQPGAYYILAPGGGFEVTNASGGPAGRVSLFSHRVFTTTFGSSSHADY